MGEGDRLPAGGVPRLGPIQLAALLRGLGPLGPHLLFFVTQRGLVVLAIALVGAVAGDEAVICPGGEVRPQGCVPGAFLAVERRRPLAGPSPALAVPGLISGFRKRAADPAPTQVGTVRPRRVRLVTPHPHPQRPDPRPAHPEAGNPDGLQHGGELRTVTPLTCCDQNGQRFLPLLAGQVDPRGPAAARAAQPVVVGLSPMAARGFLLGSAVAPGAGRVLMGAADRGVDVHVPRDQSGGVRTGLQPRQDDCPGTTALPATEESADRLPRTVLSRQIPPWSTRPHSPTDPVDQPPPTQRRPAHHRHRPSPCWSPRRACRTPSPAARLLDHVAAEHPGIRKVWVDGGYRQHLVEHAATLGIDMEITARKPGTRDFTPIPKRWTVERTYGWLMLHRRPARGYETLPTRSEAVVHLAMTDLMARRLTGENTISWRDPTPQANHQIPG